MGRKRIVMKTSEECKILEKKVLFGTDGCSEGDVVLLKLEWTGDSYPGCFFQLQPRNAYLRRPISLCGAGDGYILLAIRVAGEGTRDIVSGKVGETVACFGPLGRGFELGNTVQGRDFSLSEAMGGEDASTNEWVGGKEESRRMQEIPEDPRTKDYLVIGGGIGVAPLLPLISSFEGRTYDFVAGFREGSYLCDGATHLCVEAGEAEVGGKTAFHRGTVLPVVEELLSEWRYRDVFVCGPKKMLEAVALLCMRYGYDPQLLTEAHMGCGVGACLACTIEVKGGAYARVCADGPMFRASELVLGGASGFGAAECCGGKYGEGASGTLPSGCTPTAPVRERVDICGESVPRTGAEGTSSAEVRELGGDTAVRDTATGDDATGAASPAGFDGIAPSGFGAAVREPDRHNAESPLAVDLGGLHLKSLLTTASGTFGFGREYNEFFDIGILGAVSVKGLTLHEKAGNPGRRVVEVYGGMINSVGLQNPGVDAFLEKEVRFLKEKGVAVIANINGESVEDMEEMARRVSPHVDAVELNISCPNVSAGGMSFGTDSRMTSEIVRAVRNVTTLPLIVKLTPNVTDIVEVARICEAEGADILSMINTVTGLAVDWRTGEKPLMREFGGMSGAAVKPIALRCVSAASERVRIPIIGMGGISSAEDVISFLRVGASAVAIGTAMFRDPLLPAKIDRDLRRILRDKGIGDIRSFMGRG